MFGHHVHTPEWGYAEGFDHGYDIGFNAAKLLNFNEINASSEDATEQISTMLDEELDLVPCSRAVVAHSRYA